MRIASIIFAAALLGRPGHGQTYSSTLPDAPLYNVTGIGNQELSVSPSDYRAHMLVFGSAQCASKGLQGPNALPSGSFIGDVLGWQNPRYPYNLPNVCGPMSILGESFEQSFNAFGYADHLGQFVGITATGGLPYPPAPYPGSSPAATGLREACSLVGAGGSLGTGAITINVNGVCYYYDQLGNITSGPMGSTR